MKSMVMLAAIITILIDRYVKDKYGKPPAGHKPFFKCLELMCEHLSSSEPPTKTEGHET
jgi:hypothetical protein